jgi:hypothetical protein
MTSAQPGPTGLQVEDKPEGLSKTTLIAMCSVVGILVVGCVLFLVWDSKSSHQQKISDANVAVSSAVAEAQEWLSNGDGEADAIEDALADSLQNQLVTEKSKGETVLADVQKRRAEIVAKVQKQRAEIIADAMFDSAREKLGQKEITEAVSLLKKYVADPNASQKGEAQSLLSQFDIATSDTLTISAMVEMSDETFNQAIAAGVIDDGKVTHPTLVVLRQETIRLNANKIRTQRQQAHLLEEKRQEAAKLAALERKRFANEQKERAEKEELLREARKPLRVFVGGEIDGAHAAYYRLLPPPSLKEVKKTDTGSVFDKADHLGWDSKYEVSDIPVAPGVIMSISVSNYPSSNAFGEHSEWSWNLFVVVPEESMAYRGVGFDYAIRDEVDSWTFSLQRAGILNGRKLNHYRFQEKFKILDYDLHSPIDRILGRMVTSGVVKYRLSTGVKGFGPKHEGELSRETTQAIADLLKKAEHKNWNNKTQLSKEWMRN